MSELDTRNFKKICLINGLAFLPLLILMGWPYYYAAQMFSLPELIAFPGAFLFGLPFTLTILHGIVTVSIGSVQRDYFYSWLRDHPYSFGLFYHPVLISTRFRLLLIVTSLLSLLVSITLYP